MVILRFSTAKGVGQNYPPPISPVSSHIETKFQQLPAYFRHARLTDAIADILRRQEHPEFKTADSKPEVHLIEWSEIDPRNPNVKPRIFD